MTPPEPAWGGLPRLIVNHHLGADDRQQAAINSGAPPPSAFVVGRRVRYVDASPYVGRTGVVVDAGPDSVLVEFDGVPEIHHRYGHGNLRLVE